MNADAGVVLRWTVLVTAMFVMQVGFLNDMRIFGVHPEIMLLLSICAGMVGGPERGAGVGFFCGLLVDLTLNGSLGVTALSLTLVGFFVGVIEGGVMRATKALSVLIAVLASVVGVLLYAALSELLGAHSLSDPKLWSIVAIVGTLNGVMCIPVLALARKVEGARLAY
ncbi:MAG TPA: rod shape-determining protein MreD [Microthrixaceae bacterium]|nr:rod shape-determining protein MreD [Microthrixaceae bacterium]